MMTIAGQMAGRRLDVASRNGLVAALFKDAAGGNVQKAGHLARNRRQVLGALPDPGGIAFEKPLRIGMACIVEYVADTAVLDHLPGIHYVHFVADLRNDAQVVGDLSLIHI